MSLCPLPAVGAQQVKLLGTCSVSRRSPGFCCRKNSSIAPTQLGSSSLLLGTVQPTPQWALQIQTCPHSLLSSSTDFTTWMGTKQFSQHASHSFHFAEAITPNVFINVYIYKNKLLNFRRQILISMIKENDAAPTNFPCPSHTHECISPILNESMLSTEGILLHKSFLPSFELLFPS